MLKNEIRLFLGSLGLVFSVFAIILIIILFPDIPITIDQIFHFIVYFFILVLFPLSIITVVKPGLLSSIYRNALIITGKEVNFVETDDPPSFSFNIISITIGFMSIFFFAGLYLLFVPGMLDPEVKIDFDMNEKYNEEDPSNSVTQKTGCEPFITRNNPDSICKDLYINGKNKKYIVVPLLSKSMCKQILTEGLNYAKKNNWTKKRHDDYPTTDNEITSEWENFDFIDKHVRSRVFSEISKMYNIPENKLGVNEYFIVKYEHSKQNNLDAHVDGSDFSFILALNDDYEGGGTKFVDMNKTVKLKQGECLIFSGQNKHMGKKITDGKRYILTGFLHYKKEDFCENKYSKYT